MEILAPQVLGRKVLPWEPLTIMPIGDIQHTGPQGPADMDKLQRHVTWGLEQGAVFVGMGDYIDFASPSNRARLKAAGMYDTAEQVIDDAATALEEGVERILEPTQGRWLGLVEGHHYYPHLDGTTSGQRLARFLGTTYLGDAGFLRLTFRYDTGQGVNLKVFVHHGHSGATTPGGVLTRLQRFAAHISAQLILTGHVHQVIAYPFDELDITGRGDPYLFHNTRMLVATGSFMKGWMAGSNIGGRPAGGYVEQKMMPPVSLGAPVIVATPKRVRPNRNSTIYLVDLRASV